MADDARRRAFWGVVPLAKRRQDAVVEVQRRRLLAGMTAAAAQRGFANATVEDALRDAGVSRKTFYELFRNKEECFLAAYEVGHLALIEAVQNAQRGVKVPLERIRAAHGALLQFLSDHPDVSGAFFVGIRSAGERASARRLRAHEEFAEMHRMLHKRCREFFPNLPELPNEAFLALVGGINKIVTSEIEAEHTDRLPTLLPVVMYLVLSVYGLQEAARAELKK